MTLDSRKLNAGCWENREPGWLNTDIYHRPGNVNNGAEIVCDIRGMPFDSDYFTHVFVCHVLEHVPHGDVVTALREVHRILQPGGKLCIVGPDYDRAEAAFLAGKIDTDFRPLIWGIDPNAHGLGKPAKYPGESSEDHVGADHLWCSTGPRTLWLTQQVFPDATEVLPSAVFADPEWDIQSCPEDTWQFAIAAVK